jgi:hypothetical protein
MGSWIRKGEIIPKTEDKNKSDDQKKIIKIIIFNAVIFYAKNFI